MLRWLGLSVLSLGCLERVTGEPVPLDERFTEQSTVSGGLTDDTGAPGHQTMEHTTVEHKSVPPPLPFQDLEGDRVQVKGVILSELSGAVDLDVARVDSSREGGLKSEGKMLFAEPGPFELEVPVSIGSIHIAAFQDLDKDGPSADDPYADLTIDVGTEAIADLELELVPGARGAATPGGGNQQQEHFEAPPGYGSDQAPPPDGQPTESDPFEDHEGERTLVSGTIDYEGEGVIDMDLFQEKASAPGGRVLLGKLKKFPGDFEIQVPVEIERLELDAFVDLTGDGPTGDDPRGAVRGIQVSSGPVSGLTIVLSLPEERAKKIPVDPGGTDLEEEFARTGAQGRETTAVDEGL